MSFRGKILTSNDEEILKEFYSKSDSNSLVSLYLSREPSFFDALNVEGYDSRVFSVIDEQSGTIVGAYIRSIKECYINGLPEKVAYFGSIKIDKRYRGGWILAKILNDLHSSIETDPRIFIGSIMKDNKVSNDIFFSGRGLLPIIKHIGDYSTHIFKPKKQEVENNSSLKIISADNVNLDELVLFLNKVGAKRQLFPVYKREHFEKKETGLLKGIDLNNIFVAFNESTIVGTLGLWDQSAFRKWMLYSKRSFNFIKPFVNLYSQIKGIPKIPEEKKAVPFKYVSLVCIEDDSKTVFETLLKHVINTEFDFNRKSLLVFGHFDNDPMYSGISIPSLTLKSNILAFSWQEHQTYFNSLKFDNLYIETAAL